MTNNLYFPPVITGPPCWPSYAPPEAVSALTFADQIEEQCKTHIRLLLQKMKHILQFMINFHFHNVISSDLNLFIIRCQPNDKLLHWDASENSVSLAIIHCSAMHNSGCIFFILLFWSSYISIWWRKQVWIFKMYAEPHQPQKWDKKRELVAG